MQVGLPDAKSKVKKKENRDGIMAQFNNHLVIIMIIKWKIVLNIKKKTQGTKTTV